jgi:hypothetical protein
LLKFTAVVKTRPLWMRGLRLYDIDMDVSAGDTVHACSRFRSVDDPDRFALYFVHEGTPPAATLSSTAEADEHTLMVVREFRRVPLHASALALTVFTARPGRSASLVAALAHFAERAVSAYQPAYLLLAHSLEAPSTVVLITGVHERAALQEMRPNAFSIDLLLPEIQPLLADDPEWYAYCPDTDLFEVGAAVSQHAV